MAKHSYEFKKKVVTEYLNGGGSYGYLAKKYDLKSETPVKYWVKAYKALGDEGLAYSKKNKNYSFEFKMYVVKLYLTTDLSYQELSLKVGINNPSLIGRWISDYRIAGADALLPKRKGWQAKVKKPKRQIPKTEKEKADAEYLRQLEEENLKLRIENAYLKEMRRLRLEDEAKNGRHG